MWYRCKNTPKNQRKSEQNRRPRTRAKHLKSLINNLIKMFLKSIWRVKGLKMRNSLNAKILKGNSLKEIERLISFS